MELGAQVVKKYAYRNNEVLINIYYGNDAKKKYDTFSYNTLTNTYIAIQELSNMYIYNVHSANDTLFLNVLNANTQENEIYMLRESIIRKIDIPEKYAVANVFYIGDVYYLNVINIPSAEKEVYALKNDIVQLCNFNGWIEYVVKDKNIFIVQVVKNDTTTIQYKTDGVTWTSIHTCNVL